MNNKPAWLKVMYKEDSNRIYTKTILNDLAINTVCQEANCPNYLECFANKTASFMILGIHCTRNCRFCNVSHGKPLAVDRDEPMRVALAVKKLNLAYVVITSVTRDDLPDKGAQHFNAVVNAIQQHSPQTEIETLIPDLLGDFVALKTITKARPAVISHNMETVHALYGDVRLKANYFRSLSILENIKLLDDRIKSKSGIMVGLGESETEVIELMKDLRRVECDILTIGQYLAPSYRHYPVKAYIHPEQFTRYKQIACDLGFTFVTSAPFVRSSYKAHEALLASANLAVS